MTEITAFEPVTVTQAPSVTLYRDHTYRSDLAYIDASGDEWTYFGIREGDSLWRREGDTAAWNITAVVDQFGPLANATA